MSLHALANHMAAQGRNGDSVLVHMTPKEVNGLHALAVARGSQLTTNPQTGLPEAFSLGDLLPAVLGFGLDMFLPGLGEAVGGAFGLSAAAGTGIAVGGLTGLATGNLSKGVMAGFGAYGGAGLAEGLMGAGTNNLALQTIQEQQAAGTFPTLAGQSPEQIAKYANEVNAANSAAHAAQAGLSPMDRLTAGFSATTQSPSTLLDYAKGNGKYLLAAAAPALMGGLSEESQTVTPMADNRMITPFVMNRKAVPRDNSLSPSAQQRYFNYDVTPITPVHAANGGVVKNFANGGDVGYESRGGNYRENNRLIGGEGNGVAATDPYTQQFLDKAKTYQNTMTGDSASAFDYLMGNTRPGVPATTNQQKRPGAVRMPGVNPTTPATPGGIQDLANIVRGDGGGGNKSFDAGNGSASTSNPFKYDPNSLSGGIVHALLNPTPNDAPIVDTTGYSSVADAEAAGLQKLANQYGMYNNPSANLTPTGTNVGTVSQPNPISGYSIGPAPAPAPVSNPISGYSIGPAPTSVPAASPMTQDPAQQQQAAAAALKSNEGDGDTKTSETPDHDTSKDAKGGFLNHGKFDQRYADGGVTGGGSLDLHVPINLGGGQGGGGGGGFGGGNGIQQGGMPQSPMGGLGGFDPKAVAANPQGFSNFLQGAMNQEQARPGSTMLSGASSAFGGGMGGMRGGFGPQNNMNAPAAGLYGGTPMSKPSYEQYLAGRSSTQQDVPLSRGQYENPQQGFSTPGSRMAEGGITALADGGLGSLGGYSDGGRLLRGPGDGVSDSIPAVIGQKQPARLADGEFVVPARIVSELGNGSTEAGARQLYAMMDRIQKGRKKTVGKNKVAANTRAAKHLPA